MLRFLSPGLLPFAALAAVPVIIHILSRLRLQRAPFPSLELLHSMQRERFSWLRLKELLLLLLRTATLLFLMLALARPTCTRKGVEAVGDVVILLDDSYSMAYESRFARARAAARAVAQRLSGGSRAALLLTSGSGRADSLLSSDPRGLLARIDSVRPSGLASTVTPALDLAVRIAARSRGRVLLISDLQERAFPNDSTVSRSVEVSVVDVGSRDFDNAGVARVFPERTYILPGRPVRVCATCVNHGPRPVTRTALLVLRDRREEQTISLAPGARTEVVFDMAIDRPGPCEGRVELRSDSLAVDDVRYFAWNLPERVPLLIVESPLAPATFLSAALAADSLFDVTVAPTGALGRQELRRFRAIVATDAAALSMADWDRLDFVLRGGGSALVMTPNPVPEQNGLGRYGRYLGMAAPAGFVKLSRIDSTDPAAVRGADLAQARFFRHARLSPVDAKVTAWFSDGDPAIIVPPAGNLRVWTFAPLLEQTDLVYRAGFVPLLHSTLVELALGRTQTDHAVGDTVRVRLPSGGPVLLSGPSYNLTLTPLPGPDPVAIIEGIGAPGLYRLGSEPPVVLAVSPDPAEGDLSQADLARLRSLGLKPVSAESLGSSRELSGLVLLLAAAAFALEMLLLAL